MTRPDALATARALVGGRFPTAQQAWLSGSVVHGRATSTSDLDITVLLEHGQAGRQSLEFRGWPVEVFVHTRTSLRWFVRRDVERRRPTMARLVAEGVALLPGSEGEDLRAECAAVLEAGPGPLKAEALTMARYTLTDLLDDLAGCDDPEQLDAIAVDVWRCAAELHLASNNTWTGSGKWLVRELQHLDESNGTDITRRLRAGLQAAVGGDKVPLRTVAERVLQGVGGRLWVGLELAAPPAAGAGQPGPPEPRSTSVVRLEPVTSTNWRDGLAVRARRNQAQFVAAYEPVLLVILAKTALRVGGVDWWAYLLKDQSETVGVVGVADCREQEKTLVIFHLLIDEHRQREGYGRVALQRLLELGRRSQGCESLRLTVNPLNAAAIALYTSAGFEITGTDADGELQMARAVAAAPF